MRSIKGSNLASLSTASSLFYKDATVGKIEALLRLSGFMIR
ncbi:hypothetical protein P6U16_09725 [Rhizobium sp. 32-5/1]|nr:hypothetical protein [Rhizobium sp. 32-5/1]WEZ84794.1 hypothetical protein P6U16_09725 [Rhizobium sp. 32-5/1]